MSGVQSVVSVMDREIQDKYEAFKGQFERTPHVCEAFAKRLAGPTWETMLRLQLLHIEVKNGQIISVTPGALMEAELQEDRN